jgi:hypothetical protein
MWWMLARIAGWEGNGNSTGQINTEEGSSETTLFIGKDYIRIDVQNLFIDGNIRLYQLNGSMISMRHINDPVSFIDTSSLASGYYIVVLSNDQHQEVKNFVLLQ